MTSTSSTQPAPLRIFELCYRYAYLEELGKARRLRQGESGELLELGRLLAGDADSSPRRRGHRRFPVRIAATIKGSTRACDGWVLDLSAGGLYIVLPRSVEVGATVQVRLTSPDGAEYVFTGRVVRRDAGELFSGYGLSLCCVPLEMRRRRAA